MAAFWASLCACLLLCLPLDGAPAAPAPTPALRPIVIDPGHGGEDLGAVAARRYEKDIVLAVARRLREFLLARGLAPVSLVRDTDEFVTLDGRVEADAVWDGALFVSLHVNTVFRKGPRGALVYAWGRERGLSDRNHRRHRKVPPLPPPPPEQIRASMELAAALARGLREEGVPVAPLERADYYVLKNPKTPSVLVELGFLSNPQDAALLIDPAYQDRLAAALAQGLADYISRWHPPRGASNPQVRTSSIGR